MRTIQRALGRLSIFVWAIALGAPGTAAAEERIGVIAGFSGPGAEYGMAYRRGVELAKLPVGNSFFYEDDQFTPAKTIAAFNKLIQFDKISKVIIGDTVTAQAIVPIAKRRGIPIFVWASEAKEFESEPLVTRLWDTDANDFDATTALLRERGFKRVALFTSAHTYANNWGAALAKAVPGSTHQMYSLSPQSFQADILKAITTKQPAKFDALGICLNPGENGVFARQLRQLKSEMPLFACCFVEATADIEAAAGAFSGVSFTAPKVSPEFIEQYVKRFGATDHLISAAIFHDAALLASRSNGAVFALEGLTKITPPEGGAHLRLNYGTYEFSGRELRRGQR